MPTKKPTKETLQSQAEKLQEAIRLIDGHLEQGQFSREQLESELEVFLQDESLMNICKAYMDWKCPDSVCESESDRTLEDILEFGDIDDDDNESVFRGLIDEMIKQDKSEKRQKANNYIFLCGVNDSDEDQSVEEPLNEIVVQRGDKLHIDMILPDVNDAEDLMVAATTDLCDEVVFLSFKKSEIPGLLDGNRLHLKTSEINKILACDSTRDKNAPDFVTLDIFIGGDLVRSQKIPLKRAWLNDEDDSPVRLDDLGGIVGWRNFKARIDDLASRCDMAEKRRKAGLVANMPNLHTVIIGNPGTGKTRCIPYLSVLFKSRGLLSSYDIYYTSISSLSSGVGNEYDNTLDAVRKAKGGILVFENAHELYRIERVNNYDLEQRIIRALTDALNDVVKFPGWALVLEGEAEGIETMLSANPGLGKHFDAPIVMEDFTVEELKAIAIGCCKEREITLTDEAWDRMDKYILHKCNRRGPGFRNAWIIPELLDEIVVPSMYRRLQLIENPDETQMETVEASDIPLAADVSRASMDELDQLIGLGKLKAKIKDYLNAVKLAGSRIQNGLPTNMPRLHMAFLGNPGTGKTTVAEIIAKVFASWGILSGGRVIRTEKSQMVGQYIGETEFKMRKLLERARGNILFIDEAYQLVEGGERDFGRIVMNSLLTELGKDNQDMVVILAGYTAPMKQLLESNEGIESRFPNVFNFEDYTTDELLEIAKLMIKKQGFVLSPGAEANMRIVVEEESEKPSPRFGNGRFISNLLQNEIMATLGARVAKIDNPSKEDLNIILPEDVVVGRAQKDVVFDNVAIDAALARLNRLSGLAGVKVAISSFVKSVRYLHSIGEPYVGKGLLSWRFIGKSGTGKSTVAEIMASILKGMRLIANSHITEIKGERILGVSEPECDAVLKDAVKRSCNGLIFIDVDEPKFGDYRMTYGRNIEQIRLKVKEMTVEVGGECALVVAELNAPNADLAEQMSDSGVYEFDHTLIFKDFSPDELYDILCQCLRKLKVAFSPEAERHIREYIEDMNASFTPNARTMKLMARTIHQQVILREADLPCSAESHLVLLEDVEGFRWNGKKGKIGF